MIDGGLRKLFHKNLPGFHWQAIETGGVGLGVPDSNFCREGVEGWVEFKTTDAFKVQIRPEQVAWIERRARAGGRVFIAVRRKTKAGPRKGPAVDELWLLGPEFARMAYLNKAVEYRQWESGPKNWNWEAIQRVLTTS